MDESKALADNPFGIDKHANLKPKIAVSGSAATEHLATTNAFEACKELGREIVKQGAICITGATTGVPIWSARGAKEAGGISVGLSPASGPKEHVSLYNLPLEYMDLIIYTGFGFVGRDMLMTRTSDAIIIGPGRIGTIHEFTVAFEDQKPIGILEGDWDTDETIKLIIERSHRQDHNPKVVFDSNPKTLVGKIMELIKKDKEFEETRVYRTSEYWASGGGAAAQPRDPKIKRVL